MQVTPDVRNSRLKRFTVPLESQGEFESVRLWRHVSKAIGEDDQVGATEEKSKLEEEQRAGARERKATGEEWVPRDVIQSTFWGDTQNLSMIMFGVSSLALKLSLKMFLNVTLKTTLQNVY